MINYKNDEKTRVKNINNFYEKFWPPSGEPIILTDYNMISDIWCSIHDGEYFDRVYRFGNRISTNQNK